MQEEFQAELYNLQCLGDEEFDCKYHELVFLILNLALFMLKTKIVGIVFRCVYSYMHDPNRMFG
jgi:hypothetical protein